MCKTILTATIALVAATATGCGGSAKTSYTAYGEPMKLDEAKAIPVARILASPDEHVGKTILVSGVISEVCVHKGCWIRVADRVGGDSLFVKFVCPVEGRLVPVDAVGQSTLVEGTLVIEELSEGEARHYAEDGGKSPEEVAKIVGPQKLPRMKSPAARIARTPTESSKPEKS